MKVGDFGTGGRVYVRTVDPSEQNVSCASVLRVLFLYIPLVIAAGVAMYCEWNRGAWLRQLDAVTPDMFVRNGELNVQPLVDEFFGWELPPNTLSVDRKVEYCQWKELRHTRREKNDRGETVEVTSFSYVKGWHPFLINSVFFDASVAYANNPRDPPFPRLSHAPVSLNGRHILSNHAKIPVQQSTRLALQPWHWDRMSHAHAWAWGFRRMDPTYAWAILEDVAPTGAAEAVARGAAQFFLDGVVGTGVKGICEPGDVRVNFMVNLAPRYVSAVIDGSGSLWYARIGDISLDALLESEYQSIQAWLFWSRVAAGCLLLASSLAWFSASHNREKQA
jgi:hypothetical protein